MCDRARVHACVHAQIRALGEHVNRVGWNHIYIRCIP